MPLLTITIVAVLAIPVGHAVNNVHPLYLGSSAVGSCTGKCENLATTSGTADTGTSQSITIGAAPGIDTGTTPKVTGTWTSGTSFTLSAMTTGQTSDSILLVVEVNPDTVTVSTSTKPSGSGMTFDSTPRTQYIGALGSGMDLEEWHAVASGTLSSVTITVTLTGTPTAASAEAIAIHGAEDPTATLNVWDKAAGYPGTASKTGNGGGSTQPILATGVTALNAKDFIIGMFGSSGSLTETAGTGFTIDLTVASSASIAVEHKTDTSATSETCPFGGNTSKWLLICDAYQSAPVYYVIDPDAASTTTTATPSTSSPTGYAWVYNTAGIQTSLNDIQSGTWQID